MTDSEPRVPDIILERYRLKELPAREAERVADRLRRDDVLRQRLEALDRSDAEILRQHSPELLAARVRQTLATRGDDQRAVSGPGVKWVLPALMVTAAIVLMVLGPRAGPPIAERGDDDVVRLRGELLPALAVYRRTADGSETLADGAVAHAGDLLRIGYRAAGRQYGVILSVDGRSVITMHLPPEGDRAVALEREATVLLDRAYELDDAPRWEQFYFVTGETPFAVQPIVDAAKRAAATEGRPPRTLALPPGFEQTSFSLQKE